MYGRPAKCVACHLKWFIPEREEVPESAVPIHLADHPELLRKPGQLVRHKEFFSAANASADPAHELPPITGLDLSRLKSSAVDADTPGTQEPAPDPVAVHDTGDNRSSDEDEPSDAQPSDDSDVPKNTPNAPIDALEPLRILCGYRAELQKRMQAATDDGGQDQCRPVLDAYGDALTRAWSRLNARLDAALRETASEVDAIDSEIAAVNVALRVGELALHQYTLLVKKLRRRRECLMRHRYNLLGWRYVDDLYIAGGTSDITLESFDEAAFTPVIPAPADMPSDEPLFAYYGSQLRSALQMRMALERRKAAWIHMGEEKHLPSASVEEGMFETEAALARNAARIRFYRDGLERMLNDCEMDLKSLAAYKSAMVEKQENGDASQPKHATTLETLERTERDIMRAKGLIKRTLSANAPPEVPKADSTLVHRLRGTLNEREITGASALFFVAALVLFVGILLFSDTRHEGLDWVALGLTCSIVGTATCVVLLDVKKSGLFILGVWLVQLFLISVFVYYRASFEAHLVQFPSHGVQMLGFASGRGWVLVLGAACAGAATAIVVANYFGLAKRNRYSVVLLVLAGAYVSGAAIAMSHAFASRAGTLDIEEYVTARLDEEIEIPNDYIAAITEGEALAENDGHGEDPEAEADETAVDAQANDNADASDEDAFTGPVVMFAMHGVVHGEDTEPRFRTSLTYPDGRVESMALRLGDAIFGDWKAREYNRYAKTLVISDETRLLVLQAGDSIPLPDMVQSNDAEGENDTTQHN